MPRSRTLADGSVSDRRMEAACVRALDAYMMLGRHAARLLRKLNDMTTPGVVKTHIDPEDSLVLAIQSVTASKRS